MQQKIYEISNHPDAPDVKRELILHTISKKFDETPQYARIFFYINHYMEDADKKRRPFRGFKDNEMEVFLTASNNRYVNSQGQVVQKIKIPAVIENDIEVSPATEDYPVGSVPQWDYFADLLNKGTKEDDIILQQVIICDSNKMFDTYN